MASIIRDCWPPENVDRRPLEFRLEEPESHQDFLDAVIDGVSVLVLDQVMQFVIAPPGPLAVVCIDGFGHFLGGLLELGLQLEERGDPRFGDFDQRFTGLERPPGAAG